MGTKLPAAQARLFRSVFICKNCNQKMRSEALKVISKTIRCRKCGKHSFRAIRMKKTK